MIHDGSDLYETTKRKHLKQRKETYNKNNNNDEEEEVSSSLNDDEKNSIHEENNSLISSDHSESEDSQDEHFENFEKISLVTKNHIDPLNWAKSLFDDEAHEVPTTSTTPHNTYTLSKKLQTLLKKRPPNLEMVSQCELNIEPFWRTQSIEEIEKTWLKEHDELIEAFQSKHRAAQRILGKARNAV